MADTAILYSTAGRFAGIALCCACPNGAADLADPKAWADAHNQTRHGGRMTVRPAKSITAL